MLIWPFIFLALTIALLLIAQRTLLSPTSQEAPDQPIDFPHTIHSAFLDCSFCHRTATTEASAGLPAVEQCMFCHQVVQPDRESDIPLVLEAWENGEPIEWNRVHQLPDHVQFVHEAHINAGFDCSTCHGDVNTMTKIKQVRDLRMNDCVQCHKENNAPTDCTTCHY